MADNGNNSVVFGFCDLLGLVLALPAGDAFYKGEPVTLRMGLFAVVGFASVVFGHSWGTLKSKFDLPAAFSATVQRVAYDFRWWLAVILVGFIFGDSVPFAHISDLSAKSQVGLGLAGLFILILVWVIGSSQVFERANRASQSDSSPSDLLDQDAENIVQRVHFFTRVDVLGEPKLTGTAPFIEFNQSVINASVFPITFESEIEGRIRIDGEEQRDTLEMRPGQNLQVLRGASHDIALKHWLTPLAAKKMQDSVQTVFNFGHAVVSFTFDHRGQRRTIRKALGNQVVWKRLPDYPHPLVTLQVFTLDPRVEESDPRRLGYRAKLTFIFTNESGRSISVLPPSFHGVPIQVPLGYAYRLEASLGRWKQSQWDLREVLDGSVAPGWSFKLWLGLDPSVPHAELEKNRDQRSLGTLMVPIKIGDQERTLQYFV